MNSKVLSAICLFLVLGFALSKAEKDESSEEQSYLSEGKELDALSNDENPKAVEKDSKTETSVLVQNDNGDTVAAKHKGFCHWGVSVYYKPGFSIRCSCLKCICQAGGKWDCAYNFAYCPYFYCGNQIYNPSTQICCCGKVHTKKAHYGCCGYFYYNNKISKCCNFYTVKPKNSNCPRYKI